MNITKTEMAFVTKMISERNIPNTTYNNTFKNIGMFVFSVFLVCTILGIISFMIMVVPILFGLLSINLNGYDNDYTSTTLLGIFGIIISFSMYCIVAYIAKSYMYKTLINDKEYINNYCVDMRSYEYYYYPGYDGESYPNQKNDEVKMLEEIKKNDIYWGKYWEYMGENWDEFWYGTSIGTLRIDANRYARK